MNQHIKIAAFATIASIAVPAHAAFASDATMTNIENKVNELCGTTDIDQMARSAPGDVSWTANGFHVASLKETVPFGDDRLVFTDAQSTYLCTQGTNDQKTVRWLFIPRKSLF